jgi:hypothetical protein
MAEHQEELWMSQKERERLKGLHEVRKRHITQEQAGKELGMTARWVRELLRRMKARGDRAVVHGLRGKRSNRRLPEAMKARAVKLFGEQQQARQWHDYGPTLAAEELAEHGLQVGKETLRQWLREAGLWKARRARVERVHQWRRRRARWGELLRICQVFCVNDQVFVPGVAVGFAVAVGFGDGLQGKGAVPLPLRPRRLKN